MHQIGEGDARTICILLPYNPVVLLLQQHSKESSDRLFHSVWEETQITLMERKNEPAQVTMQIWPNATHISIKMVFGSKQVLLTFMALKSFFIFSGIPVMKESSGSSRISLFSNLEERTEGKKGSQRTSCSSDWYKTLADSNWFHRGVTGTLRNTRPQRRGQETQPVFYPFLAWVTIGCCTR